MRDRNACPGKGSSRVETKVLNPALEQPCGHGPAGTVKHLLVCVARSSGRRRRPVPFVPAHGWLTLSQHGVDETRSRPLSRKLHQLNRLIDGGCFRDFSKEPDLVNTEPQNNENLEIEMSDLLSRKPLDFEIEIAPPAQHTHYKLGRQLAIRLFQVGHALALQQLDRVFLT